MGNIIKKAAALCLGTAVMLTGTLFSADPEPVSAADARTLLSESVICVGAEPSVNLTLKQTYDGYMFETNFTGNAFYALLEISATRPQFEVGPGDYLSNFKYWDYSNAISLNKGSGTTYVDLKNIEFMAGDKLEVRCRYYNVGKENGELVRQFVTNGTGTAVFTCFDKIKSPSDFSAYDLDVTCSAKADSAALTLMTANVTETKKDDGSISRSYESVTQIPCTAAIKDGKGTGQINAALTKASAGSFVSPFLKLTGGGNPVKESTGTIQVYGGTLNPPLLGDITGDGVIDEQDVLHLHSFVFCDRIYFEPDPYHVTELGLRTADMNKDGRIDGSDLALLKRTVLKK